MTVASSIRKAGPYVGNGVTTSFPFYFKVFDKTGVQVILTDANGSATTLVLDSDYSVALNTDQDANPGGTITYPILGTPLPATSTLAAIGGMTIDQLTDLTNGGRFLPQVIEDALDKAIILLQQHDEVLNRTLRAAVGTNVRLQFPAPSSGKFIRWRTDLLGFENADAGTDSMVLQGLLADAGDITHGSGMIGYKMNAAGSVGRTLSTKLAESVSVMDFGADGLVDDKTEFDAAMLGRPNLPVSMGDKTFILGSTLANNGSLSWAPGRYSNTTAVDPIDWSKVRGAQAMTWGSGGRSNYSVMNSNFTEHDLYNAVFPDIIHFSNLSSTVEIAPGSTIYHTAAVTGAVKSRAVTSGINGNGVALFGLGTAEVNSSAVWGLNTLLQDAATRVAGTGTGRVMIGGEFDFNVMNPGTQIIGVSVGGNSLAQPTNANAFIANTLGNGNRWQTAFWAFDGAANTALAVGTLNVGGTNVPSQTIQLAQIDNNGTKQVVNIVASPGGASAPADAYLTVGGSSRVSLSLTDGDLLLATGHALVINSTQVVGSRMTGWTASTGALNRGAFDADYSQTISGAYSQAQVQSINDTLRDTRRRVHAIEADLRAHGLIN